jgi:hypothetical protein
VVGARDCIESNGSKGKNVKLPLCLTKYALSHEDVWGSQRIAPRFLNLGTSGQCSVHRGKIVELSL